MPKYCLVLTTGYSRSILKYFYSFSAAELNSIESEDDIFTLEFSDEESDNDSDDEDN